MYFSTVYKSRSQHSTTNLSSLLSDYWRNIIQFVNLFYFINIKILNMVSVVAKKLHKQRQEKGSFVLRYFSKL